MSLAQFCIERPVLTIAGTAGVLLAGVLGLMSLPVREYPAIDPPTLTVSTAYPGAAAEIVEAQITEPLEAAINRAAGIRILRSTSREGSSRITVEFSLDTDLEAAASDVRDQLSRATRRLPPDVEPPILSKADADSSPIFALVISSPLRSQLELGAFAENLKERLQTVPGIAEVSQPAEKRYAMRLWMDARKLSAYGLTPLDVRAAANRENVELPSGRIEGDSVDLAVKAMTRMSTVEEFNDLVIKRDGDRVVRFSDVGYAELGAQNDRGALKTNGSPVAGLYFRPQPGANQIEIVDMLQQRLRQLAGELPEDIRIEVAFDNTEFVRRSLAEVTETIFIAFALVVLVVFVFLREWRTTLIPVIAIPVSVIGAFGIMAALGFSINTLTLLGIVLSIGLVVDDAIVVLENVHKKIESGRTPVAASIEGTNEVFTAVVATTMVLVAVFLPLLFLSGLSGRLFREFGMTISGAVLLSAVVALTLTPMLSARLLKKAGGHGRFFVATEGAFTSLETSYSRRVGRFVREPWKACVILLAAAAVIAVLMSSLPRELVPLEDRSRVWLRATAPDGAGYEYTQRFMDELTAAVVERVPEAQVSLTQVPASGGSTGAYGAANNGHLRLFLVDEADRGRSQQQIAAELRAVARSFTGARVNVTQEASIGQRRSSSSSVDFVVQAPELDLLREAIPRFIEVVSSEAAFSYVDSDLTFSSPEVRVTIDRDKAHAMGVSTLDIAQTMQSALSGQRFGYFVRNGKQYDVLGQVARELRSDPGDLANLSVRAMDGGRLVRLDNLISITETSAPPELFRYNRYSAATVSGTLAPGSTIEDGIAAFESVAQRVLDERFSTELTGSARDFRESSSAMAWVLLLAVVLIYLVLAAQFESFMEPFVILLTVPLAVAGALATLWYFDQTLNIFSQIGLTMLIGLVTKNGILIVEFAGQRRRAGVDSAYEAARQAAAARLRPILMTTLATVLGIVPIALALGAGAESRVSMGLVVIGGLVFGSALTLFVIPAMYVLLARRRPSQSATVAPSGPNDVPGGPTSIRAPG